MSNQKVDLAKEAIEKLKIAQTNINEAYQILINSGLHQRFARAICKNYINDSFENKDQP